MVVERRHGHEAHEEEPVPRHQRLGIAEEPIVVREDREEAETGTFLVYRRQPVEPPELGRATELVHAGRRRSGNDRIFVLVEGAEEQGGVLVLRQDAGSSEEGRAVPSEDAEPPSTGGGAAEEVDAGVPQPSEDFEEELVRESTDGARRH
jgi:hypothetical protein